MILVCFQYITIYFFAISKMSEVTNRYPNLSNQAKFRLNKISEIKDYYNSEIQKRKIMSKTRCKYIADFYYFDKILTVLSATSGGMSIISFACIVGAPVGRASASFNLTLSLTKEILKKLLEITKVKRKNTIKFSC